MSLGFPLRQPTIFPITNCTSRWQLLNSTLCDSVTNATYLEGYTSSKDSPVCVDNQYSKMFLIFIQLILNIIFIDVTVARLHQDNNIMMEKSTDQFIYLVHSDKSWLLIQLIIDNLLIIFA